MKIFAVTADVELTRKPQWFDDFRAKYDEPYPLHVTLKQPCFVEDDQVEGLKKDVADFFTRNEGSATTIPMTFDSMHVHLDGGSLLDICIMIDAVEEGALHALQKNLTQTLSTYDRYVRKESHEWEMNFQPHITIAQKVHNKDYGQAVKMWTPDFVCEGVIKSYTLVIVPELNAEEANKAGNRTTYGL